jgi:hypothetical protein
MKRTLQQHIQDDQNELENGVISPQRKRHLQDELDGLKKYQQNHPEEIKDPSPLELFCDLNPDQPECRIYEE